MNLNYSPLKMKFLSFSLGTVMCTNFPSAVQGVYVCRFWLQKLCKLNEEVDCACSKTIKQSWRLHSFFWILPPLSKPPSRRTCLIIISKLFFTALPIPSSDTLCVCVCVCVVSVIVKRPVLPPSVVDGRSWNPLYYYYYYYLCTLQDGMKSVVWTDTFL